MVSNEYVLVCAIKDSLLWAGGANYSPQKKAPPAYTSPTQQSKIERWHRSMKNQILLENYYLPGERKAALHKFADYYNHERYHESLKNLTPADVFYGRGQEILDQRETIKLATLVKRRKMHYYNQAGHAPR